MTKKSENLRALVSSCETSQSELVPKLRFPEFRGAEGWNTTPGDKLFAQINNRQAPAGLPTLAITQEHGAIPRELIDYHVSVTDKSVETYKEVRPGDFIISLRSFQGGIEHSDYHGICSPAYVILRKRAELCDLFFKQHFKSNSFIQQLTKNLEGLRDGKMVSYKQFSEIRLLNPDLPEQKKIADCLSSLDELIAAQARKVNALKTHKKGLMQGLFPQGIRSEKGEVKSEKGKQNSSFSLPTSNFSPLIPRLRFPEFRNAGEWTPKTIGQLGEVITGSTPSTVKPEYYGGDRLFVSPADISDNRFIDKTKTSLTEEGFLETRPVKANSILFVCIGSTIGKIAQNRYECATNQQINSVVPNSENSDGFVYYALGGITDKIANIAGKQAVPIVNKSLFSSVELTAPKLPEQKRIANFLSSIDETILAEIQKLEALKTHKKGLMQQLFPSPQELNS